MTSFPLPKGFIGSASSAGLKKSGKPDLGIILSESTCTAAGVFTKNKIQGANISLCRKSIEAHLVRGILVHSGQANVCTGEAGDQVANATIEAVAKSTSTESFNWVLGSTGVIGVLPNIEKLKAGIEQVCSAGLTEEGLQKVPRAMMTTDLVEKVSSEKIEIDGKEITITGFAKGSGMIHPNMATMLAYIITDAAISNELLDQALRHSSDRSFNCMTVDGDTSTSDMCVVLANGKAGNSSIENESDDYLKFRDALEIICAELAKKIARDGEGATKLITVKAHDTESFEQAKAIAMSIASSSLVKTAIFGNDPNWGRIACAVGYSEGVDNLEKLEIKLMGTLIFQKGEPVAFEKPVLSEKMKSTEEIIIDINLGVGSHEATVWTCDFTYDYVKINSEYTT